VNSLRIHSNISACREGNYLENSLSPASTWLSSEPYQTISEYTPSLFADALLFDEEKADPQSFSPDWSNNADFSAGAFPDLALDPMDSLFDFEHAAKSDLSKCSDILECHYNWKNTESDFQVPFDEYIRPEIT